MRIGIIGAGSLGAALGARLAAAGHAIMFGGAASAAQAARRLGLRAGSNEEAEAFGDLLAGRLRTVTEVRGATAPDARVARPQAVVHPGLGVHLEAELPV